MFFSKDYESDFESDTSAHCPAPALQAPSQADVNQRVSAGTVGGEFALPVRVVEEKLRPYLVEKYEVDSPSERAVEMGLENFKTAGKRKREGEVRGATFAFLILYRF